MYLVNRGAYLECQCKAASIQHTEARNSRAFIILDFEKCRRIRKIDSIASLPTVYYNNTQWQVLTEYNGAGTFQRRYVYGNYIEKVEI
ncbi:MAG: hypothetical protein ACYTBP_04465 [Planctomycetota bacterium]